MNFIFESAIEVESRTLTVCFTVAQAKERFSRAWFAHLTPRIMCDITRNKSLPHRTATHATPGGTGLRIFPCINPRRPGVLGATPGFKISVRTGVGVEISMRFVESNVAIEI
jgi:hypothetical protein